MSGAWLFHARPLLPQVLPISENFWNESMKTVFSLPTFDFLDIAGLRLSPLGRGTSDGSFNRWACSSALFSSATASFFAVPCLAH